MESLPVFYDQDAEGKFHRLALVWEDTVVAVMAYELLMMRLRRRRLYDDRYLFEGKDCSF